MGTRSGGGGREGRERFKSSSYKQALRIPASQLESAGNSPVAAELWQMSAYTPEGELYYRRDLIDEKHNDLMYDIYILGRDKPKYSEIEDARTRAGIVLAAYETQGYELKKKERERLEALATGDTVAAMDGIRDKRRMGARSVPKKHKASYESAAAADGRAMLEESRLHLARVRYSSDGRSGPLPAFKPKGKVA